MNNKLKYRPDIYLKASKLLLNRTEKFSCHALDKVGVTTKENKLYSKLYEHTAGYGNVWFKEYYNWDKNWISVRVKALKYTSSIAKKLNSGKIKEKDIKKYIKKYSDTDTQAFELALMKRWREDSLKYECL